MTRRSKALRNDGLLFPSATRSGLEKALSILAKDLSAALKELERTKARLLIVECACQVLTHANWQAQAPAEGKARAKALRIARVVTLRQRVDEESKRKKMAAAVKDVLGLSLPTYRSLLAEARRMGLTD